MKRYIILFLSLFFILLGVKSQSTCETSEPWVEECIFPGGQPYVSMCYSFSGLEETQFLFWTFVSAPPGVSVCGDAELNYTLYDFNCNFVSTNQTGVFAGLNPLLVYKICFTANCPTDGGWSLICSSEVTTLPIELGYFNHRVEFNRVRLLWSTLSEFNNNYFEVYTSKDFENWEKIGKVYGSGDSSIPITYDLIHEDPKDGINYYRLHQVDFDGTVTLSDVISVTFLKKSTPVDIFSKYNILGQRVE